MLAQRSFGPLLYPNLWTKAQNFFKNGYFNAFLLFLHFSFFFITLGSVSLISLPSCAIFGNFLPYFPKNHIRLCFLSTRESSFVADMEPLKPRFVQELRNVTVTEGEEARLDCVIVANPWTWGFGFDSDFLKYKILSFRWSGSVKTSPSKSRRTFGCYLKETSVH